MAYYPRFIGGAEVALKELTDRLSGEYEFHLVTLRYASDLPKTSKEGAVVVHRIGPGFQNVGAPDLRKLHLRLLKPYFQFAAYVYARGLHRKEKFDALWAMMAHSAGVPAALFKREFPSVPYVLTLQEGDPPEHIERQMRVFGPLFRAAFTRADAVSALSVFLSDWGMRMGAKDVEVIPNGVDVAKFSQALSADDRTYIRSHLGIRPDESVLVTSSRLVRKNGVDVVLDAMKSLPQNIKFLILGDGPERGRLEAQAQRLELSERALFSGEVPNAHLPEYLHASDIFVRASRSEGQGISFIEALAAGLPTVGTAVGGIVDFLREGETGFVATTCDAQEVASAIRRALEDSARTRKIAAAGQALARKYEWDLIAARMQREVFKPLWKK